MKLFKQSDSYISRKVKLYGDIDTEADITIDGEVYGNVRSKKSITLGASAHFEGNIESETALIRGYFKGRIVARNMLEVKNPATIVGDLISDSVRVDSGVSFQGQIFAKVIEKENMPVLAAHASNASDEPSVSHAEECTAEVPQSEQTAAAPADGAQNPPPLPVAKSEWRQITRIRSDCNIRPLFR